MHLLLALLFALTTFARRQDAGLLFEQTFPRDNTYCAYKGNRVEIQLRGTSKYIDQSDSGIGEYAFYSFDKSGKNYSLLPLNKDLLGSYKFFVQNNMKKSLCSKSWGFPIKNETIGILFLEDNRPFGDKLVIQLFDLRGRTPKEVIQTNFLVDKARVAPEGFYFRALTERLEMDMGKVLINGKEFTYQDRAFPTWMLYTSSGFSVEPRMTFANFNWRKYFKDEADFLKTSDWDSTEKKFGKKTVYFAVNHQLKKSCVLLSSSKRKLSDSEPWHCIQ